MAAGRTKYMYTHLTIILTQYLRVHSNGKAPGLLTTKSETATIISYKYSSQLWNFQPFFNQDRLLTKEISLYNK